MLLSSVTDAVAHQFGERHHCARTIAQLHRFESGDGRTLAAAETDSDRNIFLGRVDVQQSSRFADRTCAHQPRHLIGRDAVQRGFFLVDAKLVFGLIVLDVPVDIHDAIGAPEQVADLARDPSWPY